MATTTKKTYKCTRCNGTGRIGHYSHVEEGVCFACSGSGEVTRKPREKKVPTASVEAMRIANAIVEKLNNGEKQVYGDQQHDDFECAYKNNVIVEKKVLFGDEYYSITLRFNPWTKEYNSSWGTSLLGIAMEIDGKGFIFNL